MNQLISSNNIQVSVGGQTFFIPQEKAQQLLMMLQQWQSINATEAKNNNAWNGKTLIHG